VHASLFQHRFLHAHPLRVHFYPSHSNRPVCSVSPGEWALQPTTTERNNAELLDAGEANQRLSVDDIEAMKRAGKAGAEIVEALSAGSATFGSKTEFSQASRQHCSYWFPPPPSQSPASPRVFSVGGVFEELRYSRSTACCVGKVPQEKGAQVLHKSRGHEAHR
jgi:Gcd10p family